MVDDDGKNTNENNEPGKEAPVIPENDTPTSNEPSPLEEADRINKEKAALLEREEKLQDRKEKLVAAEAVGGRARIGIQEETKEPKEKAKDYAKSIMEGKLPEKKNE